MKRNDNLKLGDLLLKEGLITAEALERGIREQKRGGGKLGEALVRLRLTTETKIAHALSMQLGIPFTDLETAVVEPLAVELIPECLAKKHQFMPIGIERGALVVAIADPLNIAAIQDVEFASGRKVVTTVGTPKEVAKAIETHYHLYDPVDEIVDKLSGAFIEVVPEKLDVAEDTVRAAKKSSSPPVIRMTNRIVYKAIRDGASDIHIEPRAREVVVRMRVDGLMREVLTLPKWVQGAITSRIKVIGKLDIAEKRAPQDGRVRVRVEDHEVDLRISVLPVQHGESIVIRVLDTASGILGLEGLGPSAADLARIRSLVERPQGLVLVTGPTGSGKTFTLYAMIDRIRNDSINVVSLEDPVECEMEGVKQVAVNDKTGLSFAHGLRSVLRQDPDVIMVGEMRDRETAEIALQASLTGHLVISTLHTNTAAGAITRLRNMGIPAYLIASSLNGVVAQRLVRKVCGECREPYAPDPEALAQLGMNGPDTASATFYRGAGCRACGGTGFSGRTAMFEVLVCGPALREEISAGAHEEVIRREAAAAGMRSMRADGVDKVLRGVTTVEEILRVSNAKEERESMVCRGCGATLRSDFIGCPHCGAATRNGCPGCGSPMEPKWKFCPYCAGKTPLISKAEGV